MDCRCYVCAISLCSFLILLIRPGNKGITPYGRLSDQSSDSAEYLVARLTTPEYVSGLESINGIRAFFMPALVSSVLHGILT